MLHNSCEQGGSCTEHKDWQLPLLLFRINISFSYAILFFHDFVILFQYFFLLEVNILFTVTQMFIIVFFQVIVFFEWKTIVVVIKHCVQKVQLFFNLNKASLPNFSFHFVPSSQKFGRGQFMGVSLNVYTPTHI